MGWLFSTRWSTKAELVHHLCNPKEANYTVIKSSVVGNHHWMIIEGKEGSSLGEGKRLICLNLLQSGRGDGWGYKDISEDMGPYHYDCPSSFLSIAGPPINETARDWREGVRKHHEQKKALKATPLTEGMALKYGPAEYQLQTNRGRKGWEVRRTTDSKLFRMTCQMINQALRNQLSAQGNQNG